MWAGLRIGVSYYFIAGKSKNEIKAAIYKLLIIIYQAERVFKVG